jgi:hypothetical protein
MERFAQYAKKNTNGKIALGEKCPKDIKSINTALKGLEKCICPFCQDISLKDENCNHVKCNGCKQGLCFFCSSDRRPILAHGTNNLLIC